MANLEKLKKSLRDQLDKGSLMIRLSSRDFVELAEPLNLDLDSGEDIERSIALTHQLFKGKFVEKKVFTGRDIAERLIAGDVSTGASVGDVDDKTVIDDEGGMDDDNSFGDTDSLS